MLMAQHRVGAPTGPSRRDSSNAQLDVRFLLWRFPSKGTLFPRPADVSVSAAFVPQSDRETDMPDNIHFSNPDAIAKPPGYSHVVEVTGPGRTVYFAGQLGIDKSGRMGANAREQIEIAFENVKAALASVGAGFEHVVKLNNYVVNIGTNLAHYREVRDRYVNTASPPASTTVGVPELARQGALFEVEAIAVLPPK
jgi:enamine deaminase RidA (YjgF/YER057c/UK114 family)